MVEQTAIVVAVKGTQLLLDVKQNAVCGGCGVKNGCGAGVFTKIFKHKTSKITLNNTLDLKIGDEVVIGIDEGGLLRSAGLMYLFPLISMLLFAVIAELVLHTSGDSIQIIAGAFGFITALLIIRRYQHYLSKTFRFKPTILRQIVLIPTYSTSEK